MHHNAFIKWGITGTKWHYPAYDDFSSRFLKRIIRNSTGYRLNFLIWLKTMTLIPIPNATQYFGSYMRHLAKTRELWDHENHSINFNEWICQVILHRCNALRMRTVLLWLCTTKASWRVLKSLIRRCLTPTSQDSSCVALTHQLISL